MGGSFYPYEKGRGGGGGRKKLAMLKGGGGGGTTSFGVVFTWKLEVLAILKGGGGGKKFPLFKRGVRKVLPCLEGGCNKGFGPVIFPFCSPPPPRN